MHDAFSVCLVQGVGDLDRILEQLLDGKLSVFQSLCEGLAFDVFHDQVVDAVLFAHVVEHANVRMIQAGHRPGLALETLVEIHSLSQMFGKNLDGDGAVQTGVGPPIHLSHTARTELLGNFVRTQACAGYERHRLPPERIRHRPRRHLIRVQTRKRRSFARFWNP